MHTEFHPEQPQKATGLLNVLTILTIIGSVIGLLQAPWAFMTAEENLQRTQEMMQSKDLENAPAFVKSMFNEDMLKMAQLTVQHKWTILILGVVGSLLCLIGAIQMRKLKRQGFTLWILGEWMPILASVFLIGLGSFGAMMAIGYLVPVVMTILYLFSRKQLQHA
jgi:hypothetical protein